MLAAAGIALWFAAALAFSLQGLLDRQRSAVLLGWGLALPAGLYVVAYGISRRLRSWIRHLPLRTLTLAEAARLFGGSFILWKYTQGVLPAAFALPTGISDVLIAASAIPAGLLLTTSRHFAGWHAFSLVWLVISSCSGMLTSPSALSTFPLNPIPVFFGPLMILINLAALTAAARDREL